MTQKEKSLCFQAVNVLSILAKRLDFDGGSCGRPGGLYPAEYVRIDAVILRQDFDKQVIFAIFRDTEAHDVLGVCPPDMRVVPEEPILRGLVGMQFVSPTTHSPGFPKQKRYALIQTGEGSGFYWLQSVDTADLAFVVCDPRLFVADYEVPAKIDDLEGIALREAEQAQVFVIVNKVDDLLTGNFQGPLVINVTNRRARQLVLSDKRYSTRHPLLRVPKAEALGKTA